MTEIYHESKGEARAVLSTGLAAGGFLAAFGAAACCALPIGLGMLGISGTFVGLARYTAPWRTELLIISAVALAVSLVVMLTKRPAMACAANDVCQRRDFRALVGIMMFLGAGLIGVTLWLD